MKEQMVTGENDMLKITFTIIGLPARNTYLVSFSSDIDYLPVRGSYVYQPMAVASYVANKLSNDYEVIPVPAENTGSMMHMSQIIIRTKKSVNEIANDIEALVVRAIKGYINEFFASKKIVIGGMLDEYAIFVGGDSGGS